MLGSDLLDSIRELGSLTKLPSIAYLHPSCTYSFISLGMHLGLGHHKFTILMALAQEDSDEFSVQYVLIIQFDDLPLW